MNNHQSSRERCATAIVTIFASATSVKAAEKKYDPGANDTEIKIGQTVPHSGPGSLYGVLGRHRAADGRAQISQLERRAAASAQHRRIEMERSEEQQVDHGGVAALSDRGADSRQACG